MPSSTSSRGWQMLAFITAVMGAIWGLALPRLADTKTVRDREAFLEEHQINPAAMFYTELECLDP